VPYDTTSWPGTDTVMRGVTEYAIEHLITYYM
jgi:hypothetical protein